jgi:hypothetical protein
MKKSLKGFLGKLNKDNTGGLSNGFRVLRNIRGGSMSIELPSVNQSYCKNDGTCTSTNSSGCSNNRCADATNTGCSNYGACRH